MILIDGTLLTLLSVINASELFLTAIHPIAGGGTPGLQKAELLTLAGDLEGAEQIIFSNCNSCLTLGIYKLVHAHLCGQQSVPFIGIQSGLYTKACRVNVQRDFFSGWMPLPSALAPPTFTGSK